MTVLPTLSLLNKINQFIQERKGGSFSLNYGLFLLSWKSGLRVSEAINFDYYLKHSRYRDLYLVKGKGNKKRYVYVNREIIQELKTNHWKPNHTNRINFYHFLQKTKKELNISPKIELTPHTLRRCFTTHNALNGVPMPILQKALGHANIKTTSCYWKGSVDVREFGGWLEPDSSPKEPEGFPKVKTNDNPQLPKTPQIPNKLGNLSSGNTKELELLKTIAKLKEKLTEKDKQLRNKDSKISLLTDENEKLKAVNQGKDQQLAEYRQKLKEIINRNNLLIENYARLKNVTRNQESLFGKEISPKQQLEISLAETKSLVKRKEQDKLVTEIQVWNPPN